MYLQDTNFSEPKSIKIRSFLLNEIGRDLFDLSSNSWEFFDFISYLYSMKNLLNSASFNFLKELQENNNREWFHANKEVYDRAKDNAQAFFDALNVELSKLDDFGKHKMYRIYRDTRFSQDKTPYKNHFGGIFPRRQPYNRGSFYVHLEPGNTFIGGGFWSPEKDDLLRIRQGIEMEDELENILNDPNLIREFGGLKGEQVKTTPKGFDKAHPRIDLLRYKQFLLTKKYTDDEVFAADFIDKICSDYKIMQPFFLYMTDVLTTDANGESILD